MAYTTINKSSLYQSNVLYTGNASTQSITGVGFQPDLNWIKCRGAAEQHNLSDSVRGDSGLNTGYYYIESNSNAANGSGAGNTLVSSLDADGFSIGNNNQVNVAQPFVSWNWKAGTTSGIDTTGATITPTAYSVNTTSKMSIIKYTGNDTNNAAVPHGLGVVPDCIIVKDLSGTEHWAVVTTSMTAGKMMYLNLPNAEETSQFGSTANTSVLFHLGTNSMVNSSSKDYIAYCFADIAGYSKMGSYTGNGNTDGPFVYTGFRPAFIIIKNASSTLNWEMFDNKRDGYNDSNRRLYPNTNAAEPAASDRVSILSNGFKLVTSGGTNVNESGSTFIYMAFGQTLVGTNNIPVTAR